MPNFLSSAHDSVLKEYSQKKDGVFLTDQCQHLGTCCGFAAALKTDKHDDVILSFDRLPCLHTRINQLQTVAITHLTDYNYVQIITNVPPSPTRF